MRGKPVIGVTCGVENNPDTGEPRNILPFRYVSVLLAAGAVPILVPVLEEPSLGEVLDLVDGVVIGGGPDIPPDFYGDVNQRCKILAPRERVSFDIALVRACRDRALPLLAICYGHQVANVALGATMIQDIPSQVGTTVKHSRASDDAEHARHAVRVLPGSRLGRILGEPEVYPVSAHHQAVRTAAEHLQGVAWAPDGTLEAAEDPDHRFFFTVQWHPEISPNEPHAQLLFNAMVAAASPRRRAPRMHSRGHAPTA